MRELVLKTSMSLDGFVAGLKGEAERVFGADQDANALVVETVWKPASIHQARAGKTAKYSRRRERPAVATEIDWTRFDP